MGCDLKSFSNLKPQNNVSIHAPAWGATHNHRGTSILAKVSIHAPAWGATNEFDFEQPLQDVSIHAPAWGATRFDLVNLKSFYVSIHAPAWGATSIILGICIFRMFQSTHPHGVRPNDCTTGCDWSSFNPRTRMGCDSTKTFSAVPNGFQSTHPHGVRHDFDFTQLVRDSFNPRTRMGCDYFDASQSAGFAVSIHAPAWGATHFLGWLWRARRVSIHAPAWGATFSINNKNDLSTFQSTHPHGVRLLFSSLSA